VTSVLYYIFNNGFKIGKIHLTIDKEVLKNEIKVNIKTNIAQKNEEIDILLNKNNINRYKFIKKINTLNQYKIYKGNIEHGIVNLKENHKIYCNDYVYIPEMLQFMLPFFLSELKLLEIREVKVINLEALDVNLYTFVKNSENEYQSITPASTQMIYDKDGLLNKYENKVEKIKIERAVI